MNADRRAGQAADTDAALYFRAGKLVAVETDAGTFTFGQVADKAKLSIFERITLDQLGARVSELVRQLATP